VHCQIRDVAEETAEHLACNKTHHNHMAAHIKLTHGLVYELKKCTVEQRVNMTARHMTSTRDVFFVLKPLNISIMSHNSVGDRTDILAVNTPLYVPPIHFSTYSSHGLPLPLTNECV